MYALRRMEDGLFVSKPGSERSYTNRLERAQKFKTAEEARAAACENEYVVDVDVLIN